MDKDTGKHSFLYRILQIHALSFYESKMILDRPKCFGRDQIILVKFKLKFYGLTFIIWTYPKWFQPNQNELDPSKLIGNRTVSETPQKRTEGVACL